MRSVVKEWFLTSFRFLYLVDKTQLLFVNENSILRALTALHMFRYDLELSGKYGMKSVGYGVQLWRSAETSFFFKCRSQAKLRTPPCAETETEAPLSAET